MTFPERLHSLAVEKFAVGDMAGVRDLAKQAAKHDYRLDLGKAAAEVDANRKIIESQHKVLIAELKQTGEWSLVTQ